MTPNEPPAGSRPRNGPRKPPQPTRRLSWAAARADVASVFPTVKPEGSTFEEPSAGEYRAKVPHLRRCASERADEIEINVLLQAFEVTSEREAAVEGWAHEFETTPEEFLALPFGLVGTLDEIVADVQRRRAEYGISYLTVFGEHLETFAPVVEALSGR